jgi:hypothetical protein
LLNNLLQDCGFNRLTTWQLQGCCEHILLTRCETFIDGYHGYWTWQTMANKPPPPPLTNPLLKK